MKIRLLLEKVALPKKERPKILKSIFIAALGILLMYLSEVISQMDLDGWQPVVAAGFSVLVNYFLKLVGNLKDGGVDCSH